MTGAVVTSSMMPIEHVFGGGLLLVVVGLALAWVAINVLFPGPRQDREDADA